MPQAGHGWKCVFFGSVSSLPKSRVALDLKLRSGSQGCPCEHCVDHITDGWSFCLLSTDFGALGDDRSALSLSGTAPEQQDMSQ